MEGIYSNKETRQFFPPSFSVPEAPFVIMQSFSRLASTVAVYNTQRRIKDLLAQKTHDLAEDVAQYKYIRCIFLTRQRSGSEIARGEAIGPCLVQDCLSRQVHGDLACGVTD
jgi:hypothetical protein